MRVQEVSTSPPSATGAQHAPRQASWCMNLRPRCAGLCLRPPCSSGIGTGTAPRLAAFSAATVAISASKLKSFSATSFFSFLLFCFFAVGEDVGLRCARSGCTRGGMSSCSSESSMSASNFDLSMKSASVRAAGLLVVVLLGSHPSRSS